MDSIAPIGVIESIISDCELIFMNMSLPEMSVRLSGAFNQDAENLHSTIKKFRDRGMLVNVGFDGRKAIFDEIAISRAAVLIALMKHGFEGVALQAISRLLNNHDAPTIPDTPQKIGFARVVEGIGLGEPWAFVFHAVSLKAYSGSCQLQSQAPADAPGVLEPHIWTTVDLTKIIRPVLTATKQI